MNKHPAPFKLLAAFLLSVGPADLPAQTDTSGSAVPPGQTSTTANESQEQIVKMSAFEVTTTQGTGYVATNSDAGFKTVQRLLDIPQDIQVVTRDLIDDIGATQSSVIMQFFGTGNSSFLGESTGMRGFGSKYPYTDDMPENQSYEDNFFVDNYVVVRGDAQVLYVNASPSGVILRYTKKPLPFDQTLLTASINSWGGTRALLDNTGPIGTFGAVKLGYRFVAVQQGPSYYFYNYHMSTEGLFPVLQADINNTTVRFWSLFLDMMQNPDGEALMKPDGKLYTGAGPREVMLPPNDMNSDESHRSTIVVDNKANENWDFRFAASYWHYVLHGSVLEEDSYNWAKQTHSYDAFLYDISIDYWSMIGDASGKYDIGPLSQQDNFGYGYVDELTHQWVPGTPDFVDGGIQVPLSSVAAVNALRVPAASEYPPLGSPGQATALHNQTYVTSIYWQHTMDIIPTYLTAVVGWTWATVVSDDTPNVSTVPYAATVVPASQWIHRFGVVAHPIKEISIYALNATGFAPPAGATPILYNGQQAPPQSYEGNEVGFKTGLWDGKISSTFAVFKISETNLLTGGPGVNLEGQHYYLPIGSGTGEGEDGDIELFLTKNWQLIAYGYAGKWHDVNGLPLAGSYDNSWSVYTRYGFPLGTPLRGLAIGGGAKQSGGVHISTGGINGYTFAPVPAGSTATIHAQKAFDTNFFASYPINKHLSARLSIANLTDNHYLIGTDSPIYDDASPPRTFTFELDLKF